MDTWFVTEKLRIAEIVTEHPIIDYLLIHFVALYLRADINSTVVPCLEFRRSFEVICTRSVGFIPNNLVT